MPNFVNVAISMLRNTPAMQKNQMAQEFLRAYDNNDVAAGEQLATNILNTYGIDKQTGIKQAQSGLPGLISGLVGQR